MLFFHAAVLPQFQAVHQVLPQDVAPGAHRGQRGEIGTGHPYGKTGILLAQPLAGLGAGPQVAAYVAPHRELNDTQHKAHHSRGNKKRRRGVGVHDVAHGDAAHDRERATPQVETQVGHAGDGAREPRQPPPHPVGQSHGHHQHGTHLEQDEPQHVPERQRGSVLEQREGNGYHHRREHVAHEGVGGHRLQAAAQLGRDHRRGSRAGPDDAGEHALHEHAVGTAQVKVDDAEHHHNHHHHLRQARVEVPAGRAHLAVVDFAKGHKQNHKEEPRQCLVKYRTHRPAHAVERRHHGKYIVDGCPAHDGAGQGPVFQKFDHLLHCGGKYSYFTPHREAMQGLKDVIAPMCQSPPKSLI